MKQLLVDLLWEEGKLSVLDEKKSHYLLHVRRMKEGDSLHLLTEDGVACEAQVVGIDNHQVEIKMGKPIYGGALEDSKAAPTEEASPRLILYCATLKGKKLDDVVRKAVECGVAEIRVFEAEYSVFDVVASRMENRLKRWNQIAQEAGQQSGNPHRVKVQFVGSLAELLPAAPPAALVFHEKQAGGHSIHYEVARLPSGGEAGIFVGPEGGFSKKEVALFQSRGYHLVWMGQTVMRADTAAVAALSVVSILLLEREEWSLD